MCKKLLILLTIFATGYLHTDERQPSIKQMKQNRSVRPTAPLVIPAQSPTQACLLRIKTPN